MTLLNLNKNVTPWNVEAFHEKQVHENAYPERSKLVRKYLLECMEGVPLEVEERCLQTVFNDDYFWMK